MQQKVGKRFGKYNSHDLYMDKNTWNVYQIRLDLNNYFGVKKRKNQVTEVNVQTEQNREAWEEYEKHRVGDTIKTFGDYIREDFIDEEHYDKYLWRTPKDQYLRTDYDGKIIGYENYDAAEKEAKQGKNFICCVTILKKITKLQCNIRMFFTTKTNTIGKMVDWNSLHLTRNCIDS